MRSNVLPISITHPDLSILWHPIKNGKLTPFDVSHGYDKKVWWMCENKHDIFKSVNE